MTSQTLTRSLSERGLRTRTFPRRSTLARSVSEGGLRARTFPRLRFGLVWPSRSQLVHAHVNRPVPSRWPGLAIKLRTEIGRDKLRAPLSAPRMSPPFREVYHNQPWGIPSPP